jgi:hypothetical protein
MSYDENKFKEMVENMFNNLEPKMPESKSIAFPPLQDTVGAELKPEQEELAKNKALEDLEQMRIAFIRFQNDIGGLGIYECFSTAIDSFAEYASSLESLIAMEENDPSIRPENKGNLASLIKLRTQILQNLYNKYKKGK